jgi:hypothetical protein
VGLCGGEYICCCGACWNCGDVEDCGEYGDGDTAVCAYTCFSSTGGCVKYPAPWLAIGAGAWFGYTAGAGPGAAGGVDFFFLRNIITPTIIARSIARPPITPPTIAPIGVFFPPSLVSIGVGTMEDEVDEALVEVDDGEVEPEVVDVEDDVVDGAVWDVTLIEIKA